MSVSLAQSILRHEWRKFLAAMLAVTTALTIILVQIGMTIGFAERAVFLLDHVDADLWITSPSVKTFDRPGSLHKKHALFPMILNDVDRVGSIIISDIALMDGGTFKLFRVLGFETEPTGIGYPAIFGEEHRKALSEDNVALIEKSTAQRWNFDTGYELRTKNATIRIESIIDDFLLDITSAIIMSIDSAKLLSDLSNDKVSYIVVTLRPGADAKRVQKKLQEADDEENYRVWLPEELRQTTLDYWLNSSKLGTGFWIASLIACLVGFIIIYQVIRMLILDNLREYATLRALGVSFLSISRVVLEKCAWIALGGCLLCLLLILIGRPIAEYHGMYIVFPAGLVIVAFITAFLLCMAAGLLSFRILYKSEPADLLRG